MPRRKNIGKKPARKVKRLVFSGIEPKIDRESTLFPRGVKLTADMWANSGIWVGILSSTIKAIMHSPKGDFYSELISGPKYVYMNVPATVAKMVYRCNSIGSAIHQLLKERGYGYKRL